AGAVSADARPQETLRASTTPAAPAHQKTRAQHRRAIVAAPELTLAGDILSWTATARHNHYVLRVKIHGAARAEITVTGTTFRPLARPGLTVGYQVRARARRLWSNEVWVAYPGATAQAGRQPREGSQPQTSVVA